MVTAGVHTPRAARTTSSFKLEYILVLESDCRSIVQGLAVTQRQIENG